jgi:hypothetical protein
MVRQRQLRRPRRAIVARRSRPTMRSLFYTQSSRSFPLTAFGVQTSTFTFGQLLTDIKTTGSFNRQVRLQHITVRFAPLEASNNATTLATAITTVSGAIGYEDPTTGQAVTLTTYRPLSMTNETILKARVPSPGSLGYRNSDSGNDAFELRMNVTGFTITYNVSVTIACVWLMMPDDNPNIV